MDFLDRFSQKYLVSNFTDNHLLGAELIHAYWRTDKTKLAGTLCDLRKCA